MSMIVYITFGTLTEGWCPSSPQDLVNELNGIVDAWTGAGQKVKIQFGVFLPGTCGQTLDDFIEALNQVTTGYVMDTSASVHVEFSNISACWNEPQTVVDALETAYTAYVEGT